MHWYHWQEQTLLLNAGRHSWDSIGMLIGKTGQMCEQMFVQLWEQEVRETRDKYFLREEAIATDKISASIIYDAMTMDKWYSHAGLVPVDDIV
jgi:hypothetical protein